MEDLAVAVVHKEKKMKIQKDRVFMMAAIILLAAAVVYLYADRQAFVVQQEYARAFQQGTQVGFEQTIMQLMRQASTCQPVPITYNGQTLNLIALECQRPLNTTQ